MKDLHKILDDAQLTVSRFPDRERRACELMMKKFADLVTAFEGELVGCPPSWISTVADLLTMIGSLDPLDSILMTRIESRSFYLHQLTEKIQNHQRKRILALFKATHKICHLCHNRRVLWDTYFTCKPCSCLHYEKNS